MDSVNRLRLLVELRRRGTVAAVAQALHFSPSTVSQQLSRLEAEAGTPLLEPSGRRVRLTPQAEVLADHAERILAQVSEAQAAVARSLAVVTGTVRIVAFQTAILALVSPLIGALSATHPGVRIEVEQAEPEVALRRLLGHEADLALLEEYPHQRLRQEPGIDVRLIREDPMMLTLPQAVAEQLPLQPSAAALWACAARLGWALEPEGAPSRAWIIQQGREHGVEPDVRVSTEDLLVQRRLVADGRLAAVLPEMLGGERGCAQYALAGAGRRILTATRASVPPAVEVCRGMLAG